MEHQKHLFIDLNRLQDGSVEEFEAVLDPAILELDPADSVVVTAPLEVQGRAYIAEKEFIIELDIEGAFELKCALCQEPFDYNVSISHYMHDMPVDEVKHSNYDAKEAVREAFLLEIPLFPQCGGDACENRHAIEKFLKKEGLAADDTYRPFADL